MKYASIILDNNIKLDYEIPNNLLEKIKPFLKGTYITSYAKLKEAQRIIRKVKYN